MKAIIIYRCYDCGVKKIFDENKLQEYVDFDKKHHEHSGYIMIEKIKDKSTIDEIIKEWYDITSAEIEFVGCTQEDDEESHEQDGGVDGGDETGEQEV